jgi:hypothetical protein
VVGVRNACNPMIFEPMTMSIILSQEKKMLQLGYKLQEVIWRRIKVQTESNRGEQA